MSSEFSLPQLRAMPDDASMVFWTIYDHPTDYPGGFVLRANFALKNGHTRADHLAWYASDAATLRELVPLGFKNIGRNNADDAKILEVWV